jgi:biopolymer transport protein ExbD
MLEANEFGSGFVDYGESVAVPREMNHASASNIPFKRSAMTVSLPKEGDVYWEARRTAKEDLPDKIRQSAAGKSEAKRIVYVEASFHVRHQEVVDLLKLVRRAGLDRSRLVVRHRSVTKGAGQTAWFEVSLEPERNTVADTFQVDPNPLSLVAGIGSGGKLTLNATDLGTIEDPSFLAFRLTQIFAERAQAGTAERTVVLRAANEIEYGEVAKLVDCLTGAGADPIVMQLDASIPIPRKRQLASH